MYKIRDFTSVRSAVSGFGIQAISGSMDALIPAAGQSAVKSSTKDFTRKDISSSIGASILARSPTSAWCADVNSRGKRIYASMSRFTEKNSIGNEVKLEKTSHG